MMINRLGVEQSSVNAWPDLKGNIKTIFWCVRCILPRYKVGTQSTRPCRSSLGILRGAHAFGAKDPEVHLPN